MEKEIKQLETALNELYKSNDVTRAAYSTLKFGVEQVKNNAVLPLVSKRAFTFIDFIHYIGYFATGWMIMDIILSMFC